MNTDLLIIYIRNSRDIYALTEWLQNTLLKKVNRGLTPSVEKDRPDGCKNAFRSGS